MAIGGTVFFGYVSSHSFAAAFTRTAPCAMGAFPICAILSVILPRTAVTDEFAAEDSEPTPAQVS